MRSIHALIKKAKAGSAEVDVFYPLTVTSLPPMASKTLVGVGRSRVSARDAIFTQSRYGIQFPNAGEPSSFNTKSMEASILQAFDGVKVTDNGIESDGEIRAKASSALESLDIVKDVEQAKAFIEQLIRDGKYNDFVALKANICGPGYLARRVNTTAPIQGMIGRFAEGLFDLVRVMYEKGARIIQIDEPLFAKLPKYRAETIQALQDLVKQIHVQLPELLFVSVHMCHKHDVETRGWLEKLDVDLLDLEFRDHPEHFDLFTNEWLQSNGKNIGVGLVSGNDVLVEDITRITVTIDRVIQTYDPGIVVLKPDCHLGNLTAHQAEGKLDVLKQARHIALSRLNGIV